MAEAAARGDAILTGQAELVEADFVAVRAAIPGLTQGARLLAVWGIALAAFVSCWFFLSGNLEPSQLLPIVLPAVFVVVLALSFRRGLGRAWIKQAVADQGGPTEFRFDDFGFKVDSALRRHELAWASLARWVETRDAFVVYTTPRTLLLVPKRAFPASALGQLRELLATRITPKPAAGFERKPSTVKTLVVWVVVLTAFLTIWHLLNGNEPPKHRPAHRAATSQPE